MIDYLVLMLFIFLLKKQKKYNFVLSNKYLDEIYNASILINSLTKIKAFTSSTFIGSWERKVLIIVAKITKHLCMCEMYTCILNIL